jgi:5-methylcytosine-specific restriction endonuclease McrA
MTTNNWRSKVYRKRAPDEISRDEWAEIRATVIDRDFHKCQRCEKHSDSSKGLQVHHIIPRAEGGSYDITNLITLCNSCHDIVEIAGYQTKTEIMCMEDVPVKKHEIKDSGYSEHECDKTRPAWHSWVYGGAQRP